MRTLNATRLSVATPATLFINGNFAQARRCACRAARGPHVTRVSFPALGQICRLICHTEQARALLPAILMARGARLHLIVSTLGNPLEPRLEGIEMRTWGIRDSSRTSLC